MAPRPDLVEAEQDIAGMQFRALSSPRLTDEQVLVERIEYSDFLGNGALWSRYPGMTVEPGERVDIRASFGAVGGESGCVRPPGNQPVRVANLEPVR
ncbi:MAG: hypothetical protein AAGC63_10940, partial [Propionicimonas sp.]